MSRGFSLVELIAVMLIVGILSVSAISKISPSTTMQLQSSRDTLVAAFRSAQQLAMVRQSVITLDTTSSTVEIYIDGANASVGGVQYPITLIPGQTLTPASFTFDRLGHTNAATLVLSQKGDVVTVAIDKSGYVR